MSVYTSISDDEMRDFLGFYDVGDFVSLQGIAQGITNSNYFVTTTVGRFVLTIFEVLQQEELPFFLLLKQHFKQPRCSLSCTDTAERRPLRLYSGRKTGLYGYALERFGHQLADRTAMFQYRRDVG